MRPNGRKGSTGNWKTVRVVRTGAILLGVFATLAAVAAVSLAIMVVDPEGVHDEADLRDVLDSLPYSYALEPVEQRGAKHAFAGTLSSRNGIVRPFTVSICDNDRDVSKGCPTPPLPGDAGRGVGSGYGFENEKGGDYVAVHRGALSADRATMKQETKVDASLNVALFDATGEHPYD